MLCLTRKSGEEVILSINGAIICTVTVVRRQGNEVLLGFQADKTIDIVRSEIFSETPEQRANRMKEHARKLREQADRLEGGPAA